MISRRAFIAALSSGFLTGHRHAHAQSSAKIPRIGFLAARPPAGRTAVSVTLTAFIERLGELGYVIGENVIVDVRTSEHDKTAEYFDLAAQLIAAGVDVLVAPNPHALETMTRATRTHTNRRRGSRIGSRRQGMGGELSPPWWQRHGDFSRHS